MEPINTKVISGFMELLPEEQVVFDGLKAAIESTYQQFGFTPLDTPAVERGEVLLAKGGEEADRQIYFVQNTATRADAPDRERNKDDNDAKALRFDLTVPLARYVAEHFNDLVFPFRRCHIGKVYRGERAQKGRFREFYQCDIDVIGKKELSIYYDAEIPSIIYQLFKKLDLGKFTIRINNRKVLNGLFETLHITAPPSQVLRIIDKAEKESAEKTQASFKNAGLTEQQTESLRVFMNIKGEVNEVLAKLDEFNTTNELFTCGVKELKLVSGLMSQMGVDKDYFAIDLSIARGLDYYTGTVYETVLDNSSIGSVCSGGRYDSLAENYTTEVLPGVGISIGLTRLFWQLRENGFLKTAYHNIADVIVVPESEQNVAAALSLARELRDAGLKVDTLLEQSPMKKKYQYLIKKDPRFAVVVKRDELGSDVFSLQRKQGDALVKEIMARGELIKAVVDKKDLAKC